ncbi:MAG: hypothetical protein ABIK39_02725 [candidate division WOR-3 bacterium]
MKRVWVGIVATVLIGAVTAQPLPVRLYGDSLDEQAHALVEAVDSGFCIAGWTNSYGPGVPNATNVLVIKTDPQGVPGWARMSTGLKDDEAYSMIKTNDNCYVLCGMTRSYGIGSPQANIFVTKFGQNGNKVWSYVYGGEGDDIPYSIIQTTDNGFALTGLTYSFGPMPRPNIFILKLNAMGLFQWLRVYWMMPNHMEDEGRSIVQTLDTGYVVCGRAKATNPAQYDAYLMKLNSSGAPLWVQIVPGDSTDEAYSTAIDNIGNIFVGGWTQSFCPLGDPANLFVAIFNMAGGLIGSWNYGWINGSEKLLDDRSLIATPDSAIVVCGPTTSVGPGTPNPNFLIMKLNLGGGIIWARSHPSAYDPGNQNDVPFPIVQLNWGGYAVAGYSNSYPQRLGSDNFILSTFDAWGNRPVCADSVNPEFIPMPWIQWEVTDSLYQLEMDTMPFEEVDVQYDSVCYDTSAQGVKQGYKPLQHQVAELRVLGKELELILSTTEQVNILLFSADGRLLSQLMKGKINAGKYKLPLPKEIPAGVYIVRAAGAGKAVNAKIIRY